MKNWWWEANKSRYPGMQRLAYPGVSDHRHPDYVVSANKVVSAETSATIGRALQKHPERFGVRAFVPFDASVLQPTLDLMKKGGVDPMTYAW